MPLGKDTEAKIVEMLGEAQARNLVEQMNTLYAELDTTIEKALTQYSEAAQELLETLLKDVPEAKAGPVSEICRVDYVDEICCILLTEAGYQRVLSPTEFSEYATHAIHHYEKALKENSFLRIAVVRVEPGAKKHDPHGAN